jgi:hypothetical protein
MATSLSSFIVPFSHVVVAVLAEEGREETKELVKKRELEGDWEG